ncbi:hypothetical protein GEV33_010392 [Tenebrio molitor]|uniref:Uncharacterized protein n=1 Tax=Tenebrio molitor TaxID=7067 RepID=A0A8J6HDH0_TENMO|nr:hypothetical protein GEV33_010392 [Tenebrio molitor]
MGTRSEFCWCNLTAKNVERSEFDGFITRTGHHSRDERKSLLFIVVFGAEKELRRQQRNISMFWFLEGEKSEHKDDNNRSPDPPTYDLINHNSLASETRPGILSPIAIKYEPFVKQRTFRTAVYLRSIASRFGTKHDLDGVAPDEGATGKNSTGIPNPRSEVLLADAHLISQLGTDLGGQVEQRALNSNCSAVALDAQLSQPRAEQRSPRFVSAKHNPKNFRADTIAYQLSTANSKPPPPSCKRKFAPERNYKFKFQPAIKFALTCTVPLHRNPHKSIIRTVLDGRPATLGAPIPEERAADPQRTADRTKHEARASSVKENRISGRRQPLSVRGNGTQPPRAKMWNPCDFDVVVGPVPGEKCLFPRRSRANFVEQTRRRTCAEGGSSADVLIFATGGTTDIRPDYCAVEDDTKGRRFASIVVRIAKPDLNDSGRYSGQLLLYLNKCDIRNLVRESKPSKSALIAVSGRISGPDRAKNLAGFTCGKHPKSERAGGGFYDEITSCADGSVLNGAPPPPPPPLSRPCIIRFEPCGCNRDAGSLIGGGEPDNRIDFCPEVGAMHPHPRLITISTQAPGLMAVPSVSRTTSLPGVCTPAKNPLAKDYAGDKDILGRFCNGAQIYRNRLGFRRHQLHIFPGTSATGKESGRLQEGAPPPPRAYCHVQAQLLILGRESRDVSEKEREREKNPWMNVHLAPANRRAACGFIALSDVALDFNEAIIAGRRSRP